MINLGTEALLAYSPRERDSNQEEWHATSQANGGFYSARLKKGRVDMYPGFGRTRVTG